MSGFCLGEPDGLGPRAHRDPRIVDVKLSRIRELHIAPITDLIERIRRETGLDVPLVDPSFGGVGAEVLFLLEAPARAAAHGSGMISPDNDDRTAQHMWEAYSVSSPPRRAALHWNAVPWYVGTSERLGKIDAAQVVQGRRWVEELIRLLPELSMVIAMGKHAQSFVAPLQRKLRGRGAFVLKVIHPSRTNYNTRPGSREAVVSAFRAALDCVTAEGQNG